MKVGVIGAGAWGTALAQVAARAGNQVLLWGRDEAQMKAMAQSRTKPAFTASLKLEDAVSPTGELTALSDCDVLILATPAQTTAEMAEKIDRLLSAPRPLILSAKGILRDTMTFPSEALVAQTKKAVPYVLSGPSFAHDVMAGLPTAVTLAGHNSRKAEELAENLSSPTFRLYHSDDLIGAQVGGAIKNVLAIACGIVAGRKLGASASAALTARGFAEMSRFGRALGAKTETLSGLSGLGDLILSCGSPQSRNMSLGLKLGEADNVAAALESFGKLSEGALTARPLLNLARQKGVDMPISEAVADIIEEKISIDDAIRGLLSRPLKKDGN